MADYGRAIGGRLDRALKEAGRTARWLAVELRGRGVKGASWPAVHSYLRGRRSPGGARHWPDPPAEFILEAARVLDVGVEWLLSGRGPMSGTTPEADGCIQARTHQLLAGWDAPMGGAESFAETRAWMDDYLSQLRELDADLLAWTTEPSHPAAFSFRQAVRELMASLGAARSPAVAGGAAAELVDRAFKSALDLYCTLRGLPAPLDRRDDRRALYTDPDFDWFISSYLFLCRKCVDIRPSDELVPPEAQSLGDDPGPTRT